MEPVEPDYITPLLDRRERLRDAGDDPGLHLHLGYWPGGRGPDPLDARGMRRAQDRLCRRLLELAELRNGLAVLDVGCGIGGALAAVAAAYRSMDLTGLNRSRRQLAAAEEALRPGGEFGGAADRNRLRLVFGDACALPFEDARFDRVTAIECAFHFPSRRGFLEEAARVLRPDGLVVLSDFVPEAGATGSPSDGCPFPGHEPWPDPWFNEGSWSDLASGAGLRITEREDATTAVLPSFGALPDALDDPERAARLSPVDRGSALLGRALARGRMRMEFLVFRTR